MLEQAPVDYATMRGVRMDAASNNFTSLRTTGKKDELGDMTYPPSVPFGAVLRSCRVETTASTRSASTTSRRSGS